MNYFSYVGGSYSPKNQLHKAAQEFISSKNRLLIDNRKLEKFKEELVQGIAALNARFSRCTPLKAHFWQPPENLNHHNDFFLSIEETKNGNSHGQTITSINFSLYGTREIPPVNF